MSRFKLSRVVKSNIFLGSSQHAAGQEEEKAASSSDLFSGFKNNLMTSLSAQKPEILQVDFVGPQVGKELRSRGSHLYFTRLSAFFFLSLSDLICVLVLVL